MVTRINFILLGYCMCLQSYSSFGDQHACDRECEWPPKPMECNYEFTVEWFYTMSKACFNCPYNLTDCSRPHCVPADGYTRPIISVNRQLPGPAIRVCHNDTVVVKVHNRLENEEGVTIHWHGQYVTDEPHMDGVSMLTQCPIPGRASFTYKFRADPPGTHWWHSHAGMQRSDGFAGPLIVKRSTVEDPHDQLYDIDSGDHIVFVADWLHQLTLTKFVAHHHFSGSNKGENILINGKGVFNAFVNETGNSTHFTPREVFVVEKRKKYRFRTISNAAIFCPYELTIDDHDLTVISSDGADVIPYKVTSLVVHGGERFDFVVNASLDVSNYWFRIQGMADCRNQSQLAILRYAGAPEQDPTTSKMLSNDTRFLQLNPWNQNENEKYIQISSMKPVYSESYPEKEELKGQPDQTHFIGFDFMKVDNPVFQDPDLYPLSTLPRNKHLYTPQMNNITFSMPGYPMLTQPKHIRDSELCDPESSDWSQRKSKFCKGGFCSCPYVIDVTPGNLVEVVIYDEGRTFDAGHPMHLHGQHFAVVAMDRVGKSLSTESMKELHSNGSIQYDFSAPLKDTVIIPDGGYSVVRFVGDRPGVWFFHCHLAFHSQIGMDLVFRVGKPEDWVKPPEDFPKCGTWPIIDQGSGSGRNLASTFLLFASLVAPLCALFSA